MYRLKILFKYLKAIFGYIKNSETLSNIFYQIAVSKYVFGNEKFKDWVKTEGVVEKLNIAQRTLDTTTRLISNREVDKAVDQINKSKSGPFTNISAKVSKNKHGASNHGIELGVKTKIQGVPVNFGYDASNGNGSVNIGPLSF